MKFIHKHLLTKKRKVVHRTTHGHKEHEVIVSIESNNNILYRVNTNKIMTISKGTWSVTMSLN